MKKFLLFVLVAVSVTSVFAQKQYNNPSGNTYTNPIFAGDYPDPSVLRDGEDYYIVHSSFDYYPGLLVWHSKDLINWEPVGNALNKYLGSVWAPDLIKYNNKYYIYFPANNTNYVVSADNIAGPWSEPVDLKVSNIDPGHIADDKGNRYLYFSSGDYIELTKDGLHTKGELKHVYDGWEIPKDWTIECFCMEGPKLFKRGEYYYLTTAEGGTAGPATSHMVIQARAKSPIGPWENAPNNPILRTQSPDERWWSQGHGTVFEDAHGKWWMIFHGYEKGFYNMGRQTLMLPIEWTADGWYKIAKGAETNKTLKRPEGKALTGFTLNDDFKATTLKPQWKFFGGADAERFKATANGLEIKGKGNGVGGSSPLICVPANHSYTADVEMEIEGDAMGGLVLFYDDAHFVGMLADKENILTNLRGWQFVTESDVHKRHVYLRLKNVNNTVDMFYSLDGSKWIKIENSAEVSGYNHNVLSGFLGLRIGLCSIGNGTVTYTNFKYSPLP